MGRIITIALSVSLLLACGCVVERHIVGYNSKTERFDIKKYNDFNKEVYVWEDFNFTTNKVQR